MSVFGSALSALSPNLIILVAGRGLQAAALAGLGVSSIAIIVRETEEGVLATALGRWAVWTAIAGVSGPIFSSVFVEYASWRFLFLTVVPVSVLIILLGFPSWSKDHAIIERGRIDIAGTVAAMGELPWLFGPSGGQQLGLDGRKNNIEFPWRLLTDCCYRSPVQGP